MIGPQRDRELCDAWLSPDRGGLETVSAEFVADSLAKRLIRVDEARLKYENDLDLAWGVIANVNGGDWTKQSPEWQEAAARFRDRYATPSMHEPTRGGEAVTPEEIRELQATQARPPFALTKRPDATPIGDELDALVAFRAAAARMKAADVELRAAQQEYAAAIKQLSEASTK